MQDDNARDNWDRFQREAAIHNYAPTEVKWTQRELEMKEALRRNSLPPNYFPYDPVTEFEQKIAAFFGAPFAVGIDCATHGLEICLIHTKAKWIDCPKRTYLSVPFLATKLGIELRWFDIAWQDYYFLTNRVVDASVLWREKSYIPGTFMAVSFQFQKHLSLGRAAMILCDNEQDALSLKRLSYDGRLPNIPWREQNIQTYGLHYYLQPELAQKGLDKLDAAIATPPTQWVYTDWPLLTEMEIFKSK